MVKGHSGAGTSCYLGGVDRWGTLGDLFGETVERTANEVTAKRNARVAERSVVHHRCGYWRLLI